MVSYITSEAVFRNPSTAAATGPELVPSEHAYRSSTSQTTDKQVVEGTNEDPYPEALWPGQYSAVELGEYSASDSPTSVKIPVSERKILGLRRREFWILAVAVATLMIAGAVLGGVLGTQLDNNNSNSSNASSDDDNSSTSTTDDTAVSQLSPQSRLAASRWKSGGDNGDDTEYRAVFFQDSYGALIAARWNASTPSWNIENVTEGVSESVLVPPGSSLASTSSDDLSPDTLYVWYVGDNSVISGFQIPASASGSESWSVMQQQVENTAYALTSALAATLQWCGDSSEVSESGGDGVTTMCGPPQWLLVYQDSSSGVSVINGSTWETSTAVDAGEVTEYTPLAITMRWGGDPAQVILAYQTQENDQSISTEDMLLRGYSYSGEWKDKSIQMYDLPRVNATNSRQQQFAATKWDVGQQTAWYALVDGQVKGEWFDGHNQNTLDSISFTGYDQDDPEFEAIAMPINGGLLYGIADGKVLEYTLDETSPDKFTFSSVVWP